MTSGFIILLAANNQSEIQAQLLNYIHMSYRDCSCLIPENILCNERAM